MRIDSTPTRPRSDYHESDKSKASVESDKSKASLFLPNDTATDEAWQIGDGNQTTEEGIKDRGHPRKLLSLLDQAINLFKEAQEKPLEASGITASEGIKAPFSKDEGTPNRKYIPGTVLQLLDQAINLLKEAQEKPLEASGITAPGRHNFVNKPDETKLPN
ncbi:MAG: hypothetical protein V4591_04580 [Bdellovibrionota bacterium]